MGNAGLGKSQDRIKIARININNLRHAESEQELKCLMMRVNEEGETAALKLNIQKTNIIVYGPIT